MAVKGLKGEHLSVPRSQQTGGPSFLRPQSPTAGYTQKRELVSKRRTVRKGHIYTEAEHFTVEHPENLEPC